LFKPQAITAFLAASNQHLNCSTSTVITIDGTTLDITNSNKKYLYENWDGNDYYDDELIKGYLSHTSTHRFYPTIDHKISVYFGFMNDISPEEIGALDNLCITKRYINSMKGKLIENNFNI
jgi:hypothetical protein